MGERREGLATPASQWLPVVALAAGDPQQRERVREREREEREKEKKERGGKEREI